MIPLLDAIVKDEQGRVRTLLSENPGLARASVRNATLYENGIFHWIYVGDTALHLAAAGYRVACVRFLLEAGADPNAAGNHRRSSPLHYAADGFMDGPAWDARNQGATLRRLLDHGADLHRPDANGATALHRAVRTRCAAAVRILLEAGADPEAPNHSGSTPFHLAVQNTGRGGSGSAASVSAQREIIGEFLARGVSPDLRIAAGKSVRESARRAWIRELLM